MPPRPTAVILAAGQGTRMRSDRPKVLHEAAGRPLLAWVLGAARAAGCPRTLIIVGHQAERVRRAIPPADDLGWVLQEPRLGTGHALAQVAGRVAEDELLLVLSGDAPLVTAAGLARVAEAAVAGGWGAMAVAGLAGPEEAGSLGRVLRRPDAPELLERIVEASDATPEELAVTTVNAGLYALPAGDVLGYLARLAPDNAQGEIYLTDALVAAAADDRPVRLVELDDSSEALGVNTPEELERADRVLSGRLRGPRSGSEPAE
jgi:bifunctional N-acetylglucosamine-1-phosphate-uridyltransferase/glucosamine-1-phosphate-acetyltransferase GlmU-like protein